MQYLENQTRDKKIMYTWFSAMYTRVDIALVSDVIRDDLKMVIDQIKDAITKFEALANRFDEMSEITILNKKAYFKSCKVSAELFEIIAECMSYTKQTLGYFDITVNSKNGFPFGAANVLLDRAAQSIRFLHRDVQLDLSGFVKGYVLRTIRNILNEANICDALISMGNSSILALGSHPYGEGWKVSAFNSDTTTDSVLFNQCLTTSGNSAKTKWPILKPQTKEAIDEQSALSVICSDPAQGEVLSKALYIASHFEKDLILTNFEPNIQWIQ